MTVQEMQDRRHQLARQARAILDRAENESRSLTQEDREGFDRLDAEITDLDRRIAAA